MKRNKKRLYIAGISLIVMIGIVSIFLVTRNAADFDIAGVSERDCVPYNVFVMKGEEDFSVDIEWSTKAECVGFVIYGRDRGNLDMVVVDRVNKSQSKEHIVTLEQLLTTESYYFLINSQEQVYGNEGVPLEFILEEL
jgi:hypothetical protein